MESKAGDFFAPHFLVFGLDTTPHHRGVQSNECGVVVNHGQLRRPVN